MKSFIIAGILFIAILSRGQDREANVENLSLLPVSTFADACARCHGDEGKNYGKDFAKIDREELHRVVEDMMYGPAYLEPTNTEIEAMTSYQEAVSKDEPFIVVVNAESFLNGSDESLKVETSLNSKIKNSELYSVERGEKEYQYKLTSIKDEKIEITVKRNGKTSTITFPGEIWSHSR